MIFDLPAHQNRISDITTVCFINVEFRGKVGQIVSTGDKYLAAVEENKVCMYYYV